MVCTATLESDDVAFFLSVKMDIESHGYTIQELLTHLVASIVLEELIEAMGMQITTQSLLGRFAKSLNDSFNVENTLQVKKAWERGSWVFMKGSQTQGKWTGAADVRPYTSASKVVKE